jgi:hypothetical protein
VKALAFLARFVRRILGRDSYRCSVCGATDRKMWRPIHGCTLKCAKCLTGQIVDGNGRAQSEYGLGLTDQVNDWLPAVPTTDMFGEATFWGYSSIPRDRVSWWRNLPTY